MRNLLVIAAAACVALFMILSATFDHVRAESLAAVERAEATVEAVE